MRKRMTLLAAIMALMVAMFAAAAYAATIYSTNHNDLLTETRATGWNGKLYGLDGKDEILAYQYGTTPTSSTAGAGKTISTPPTAMTAT